MMTSSGGMTNESFFFSWRAGLDRAGGPLYDLLTKVYPLDQDCTAPWNIVVVYTRLQRDVSFCSDIRN